MPEEKYPHHFDSCDGKAVACRVGPYRYRFVNNRKCCTGYCMGCEAELIGYLGKWVEATRFENALKKKVA